MLREERDGRGGMLLNLGSHSLDKVLFMSGSRIKSVSGSVGYFAEGVDVEGNGQIFLELQNGVSAVSTHCGYSKVRDFQTEYIFTGGIIKTSFDRHISVQLGEKVWEEDIPSSDTFVRQLDEFAQSITEGEKWLILVNTAWK